MRLVRSFLDEETLRTLQELAAAEDRSWVMGRQGSGYEKVACQIRMPDSGITGDLVDSKFVSALVYRCLCLMTTTDPTQGAAQLQSPEDYDRLIRTLPCTGGSDSYFLRCGPGIAIPPHTDPSTPGFEHHRLNVVLSTEHEGGNVTIAGEEVVWEAGDALIFRPDLRLHDVSTVTSGQRLLWSVGCLLPEP